MKTTFSSIYEVYKTTLKLAGEYAKDYKKNLILLILSSFFQGLTYAMFYPFLEVLFSKDFDSNKVWTIFTFMSLFTLLSLLLKWLSNNFDYSGKVIDITHFVRSKLGEKLRTMPLEKLNTYKTGDLNSTLSSNIDESILLITIASSMIIQVVLIPFTIIAVTFFVDFRLALIMLISIVLIIPLNNWTKRLKKDELKKYFNANANLETAFIEYTQGLPVLKAINKIGINAEKLQESINKVKVIQEESLYKSKIPPTLMGLFVELSLLLLLFVGAFFILNNSLALVTLGASIVIFTRLTEPLSNILNTIGMFDFIKQAYQRIEEILEIKPLKINEPLEKPSNLDIQFNNVSFKYTSKSKNTLENINLSFPSQTMTAIVGDSGCGKTTLVKLLMRYADPQSGIIKIGNANIKNLTQKELMSYISVVFQDVYLFDDTILNNIRIGRPTANKEEIIKAASLAHCHEFIMKLPNKYETTIGDIGGSLSGGEKQRISIARAILKEAPIVILDEPTTALDTQSEIVVQKAIYELVKNKTIIVIAHRLSTIITADNIIVIEDGKITEKGKHHELIEKKEKYFNMWEAQQKVKDWSLNETV